VSAIAVSDQREQYLSRIARYTRLAVKYLTIPEASRRLQMSQRTLYSWCAELGFIPPPDPANKGRWACLFSVSPEQFQVLRLALDLRKQGFSIKKFHKLLPTLERHLWQTEITEGTHSVVA